jgi:organic radical activating enzyme
MDNRNYYCSMKFKFLKIDLGSETTYNCHASAPHSIDFDWLEKNPGNLFNTKVNVLEREQMLKNERNASCEQNCWVAEDNGAQSPRLYQGGVEKTHTEIVTQPETIDLTIGADCNLTCSYCCKEYSNAWRRDIINNGNYNITNSQDNRYQGNIKDKTLLKISQSKLKNTEHYQILLKEIELASSKLKKLIVTGGEPLLDNALIDVLEKLNLPSSTQIKLYTGLGVSNSRFIGMIEKLKKVKNLLITVSSENIEELLEFNRYGIKWVEFSNKIDILKKEKINFEFHSTLSNLTIFGFKKFYDLFKLHKIVVTFAYQPRMMSPHIIDKDSKAVIERDLLTLPKDVYEPILRSIKKEPNEAERQNIKEFLYEFTKRRKDIDLTVFPKTFLEWIQIENVL